MVGLFQALALSVIVYSATTPPQDPKSPKKAPVSAPAPNLPPASPFPGPVQQQQQQYSEPAPRPYVPPVMVKGPEPLPKLPSVDTFKKKPNSAITHLKPALFMTTYEGLRRSTLFGKPDPLLADSLAMSELILTLETVRREALDDIVTSTFEHQGNLLKIETNRRLHEKNERLKALGNGTISQQEYDESLARLMRARRHATVSQWRTEEFKTDLKITDLKLARIKGEPFELLDLAKAYARLWEIRLNKVTAQQAEAQVDFDLQTAAYNRLKLLLEKKAVSEADAIHAQIDYEQAEVVMKLAAELVAQIAKFHGDALEIVKQLEHSNATNI
ncbi:MAG: hypothetical protein HYR96_06730 [Deltaproteobacteria bacterium]|nr:hypothetical protein [Deltaproteobacteria bacterium]MBI3296443.1 hypothetical protein [Deltaproteobacteria bacterium]